MHAVDNSFVYSPAPTATPPTCAKTLPYRIQVLQAPNIYLILDWWRGEDERKMVVQNPGLKGILDPACMCVLPNGR